MSKIVLHVPGGGTRDIELDRDRITIGRRADNDVHLPYPAVSGEHAAIITVLEDSFLEDLQSTNGTLVNGKRITKHFLRDHDVIDVGRVQLVYVTNDNEIVDALPAEEAATAPSGTASIHDAKRLPEDSVDRDEEVTPVDHLLAELMNSSGEAAVAVEIPPTVSVVPQAGRQPASCAEGTAGVYLEVMSGPNAGQIAPMLKLQFALGQAGATKAVIHRNGDAFELIPRDDDSSRVNGERVHRNGVRLAFGDTIEVGGVKLRFARRAPLK